MYFTTPMKYFFVYILITVKTLSLTAASSAQDSVRFAVIGDYGNAGPDELAVANLVDSHSPDFIITLGDNNYDVGSAFTIDENIGQYYHSYIYPYTGTYGAGAAINKFFPALGNHDWGTPGALPYLNYFSLPGNERYYEFVKGPVHFFVIDSDTNEYDGRDSSSIQALWLKNALSNSSSRYNAVYFHHPPYCSGLYSGSEEIMRWPFREWGADVVLSGHEHLYERLNINGLTYFVNGLGGNLRSFFGFPVTGSQFRYAANYGAMIVNAFNDSMVFRFYNIANSLRDKYIITPSVKTLNIKSYIEGFYDTQNTTMTADTVKIILRKTVSPYSAVDSASSIINSSGEGVFNFYEANNATEYYIVVTHRNSIETWSSAVSKFNANKMSYDFSSSSDQAFGNNLTLKGNKYCIYSGDINKDRIIDAEDMSITDNDAFNNLSGYVISDVNGDSTVDAGDLGITDNNTYMSIVSIYP